MGQLQNLVKHSRRQKPVNVYINKGRLEQLMSTVLPAYLHKVTSVSPGNPGAFDQNFCPGKGFD